MAYNRTSIVFSWYLALRELLAFSRASWASRIVIARIRLQRIRTLRWGSPEVVRNIVDNATPVVPPSFMDDDRLQLNTSNLDDELRNCPIFDYTPASGSYSCTIVYLHGGAYIHQPGENQWRAVWRLVIEQNARVIFPIYPKAPTYTWKTAFPPLIKLLEQTAKTGRYLLFGDSAGGGLALALCIALRDQGKTTAMPAEAVTFSPWTDLTLSTPGLDFQNTKDPWLNLAGLREASLMWVGGRTDELRNPLVSPIYADLISPLPPMTISVGTRELFYEDIQLFWSKLQEASEHPESNTVVIGENMIHVYGIFSAIPESAPAWDAAVLAVKRTTAQ